MFFRNVGVKIDSVLLVTIALGDFQNAAGADKFFDGVAQGSLLGSMVCNITGVLPMGTNREL